MARPRREPVAGGHRVGDVTPERRHYRRAYLIGNGYEFLIACSAVLSGIVFFLDRGALENSSIAQEAGAAAYVWAGLYLLGGLATAYGMLRPSVRFELAGLSLLTSAIMINACAIAISRGATGYATALTLFAFAAASLGRAWLVLALVRRRA